MAQVWDADREITESEARRLVEQQFPEFAPARLELFGAGWDNVAYLVNGQVIFRFPRRAIAVRLLENEIRCLSAVAPNVPLRVPYPEYVGEVEGDLPCPFAGYQLIPGTTACRALLTDAERSTLAAPLGQFLAALHSIPVDEELRSFASIDALRRSDVAFRSPSVVDKLRLVAPLVPGADIERLIARIEDLTTTSNAALENLRLVHGDLYARHIVVNESREISGIIDWGDVHLGDPALDISIAFSFLPPTARQYFRSAYGPIEDATWRRAQFRAIHYGALLTHYGVEVGDDAIRQAGEYALRVSTEDDASL